MFLAGFLAGLLLSAGAPTLAGGGEGGRGGGGRGGDGCVPCPGDIDDSGTVDVNDLLTVITTWGACPSPDDDCDGWTIAEGDCDDDNPNVHPEATELCNNIDDNCNNQVDEGFNLLTNFNHCGQCGNSCDDGLACTNDACVAGICQHVIQPGFCVINGECVTAGTAQPGNPCMSCNPTVSQTAWTPSLPGTPCPSGFCDGNGNCVQSP